MVEQIISIIPPTQDKNTAIFRQYISSYYLVTIKFRLFDYFITTA